jgi:hypothetical protein
MLAFALTVNLTIYQRFVKLLHQNRWINEINCLFDSKLLTSTDLDILHLGGKNSLSDALIRRGWSSIFMATPQFQVSKCWQPRCPRTIGKDAETLTAPYSSPLDRLLCAPTFQ